MQRNLLIPMMLDAENGAWHSARVGTSYTRQGRSTGSRGVGRRCTERQGGGSSLLIHSLADTYILEPPFGRRDPGVRGQHWHRMCVTVVIGVVERGWRVSSSAKRRADAQCPRQLPIPKRASLRHRLPQQSVVLCRVRRIAVARHVVCTSLITHGPGLNSWLSSVCEE